jgi:hypothetical protein
MYFHYSFPLNFVFLFKSTRSIDFYFFTNKSQNNENRSIFFFEN